MSLEWLKSLSAFWLLLAVQPLWAMDEGVADSVAEHLVRMADSLKTLSYSGTFVYLHGTQLETLQITRQVGDDEVNERLISLNGAAREVRLDRAAVTCVMPDAKAVSVDQRSSASLFAVINLDMNRLRNNYLLRALGEFRVAGRAADVVGIIPRDRMRYGYRIYLDRETGLPLKTDLMNETAQPLVQIMFTSLDLAPGTVDLAHELADDSYQKLHREAPRSSSPNHPKDWELSRLPAGFDLQLRNHWKDASGDQVEHLVLSDGLASISVYLEKGTGEGLEGGAHVGAVNAWGGISGDHQITAVGEVPAITVKQVVESIRFKPMGNEP